MGNSSETDLVKWLIGHQRTGRMLPACKWSLSAEIPASEYLAVLQNSELQLCLWLAKRMDQNCAEYCICWGDWKMTENGVESVGVKLPKQNRRWQNRTENVAPSTCITQGRGECLCECVFLRVCWLAGWWMCCCGSLRSRWAQFQHDCQPSELTASGCQQENYGACLVAYTGLIGENSGQRSPPWLIQSGRFKLWALQSYPPTSEILRREDHRDTYKLSGVY